MGKQKTEWLHIETHVAIPLRSSSLADSEVAPRWLGCSRKCAYQTSLPDRHAKADGTADYTFKRTSRFLPIVARSQSARWLHVAVKVQKLAYRPRNRDTNDPPCNLPR